MRLLLTTLNSKFSHMALGLRYMRGVLKDIEGLEFDFKEFTINQQMDYILSEIYKGHYDLVLLSVYIWNFEETKILIANLKKINPEIEIVLGGPEVTYDADQLMTSVPEIDFILMGEGELTLKEWIQERLVDGSMREVRGVAYREDGGVKVNSPRPLIENLDQVPFPYDHSDDFENRLVYYESQRGCPYNCAYCLSSTFKGVRFFPLERVKRDLKWLVDKKVPIVKFVDRTFNIKKDHYLQIMKAICKMDNGITSFHFEITASLLDQETLLFLKDVREGLFQFEIGVQSTYEPTLKAIHRHHDLTRLKDNVKQLKEQGNIHLHLDLIAGLPFEDYNRFMISFDDIYALRPDMIQLGFLKLLKGSELRKKEAEYGFVYRSYPPYEVLSNRAISYGELDRLKKIEDLLDKYYNSHKFDASTEYLVSLFDKPHQFYEWLYSHWVDKSYFDMPTGFGNLFVRLFNLGKELPGADDLKLGNAIKWDMLMQKFMKVDSLLSRFHRPLKKEYCHSLLRDDDFREAYLGHYENKPAKQIIKKVHLEFFEDVQTPQKLYLFDYGKSGSNVVVNEIDAAYLREFEI